MVATRQFDTEQVVEDAMNLFWERGYEATSLQLLTGTLGIGRGSLYAAFGSKDGLYRAALDHYLALTASAMRESLAGGADVTSTIRAAMLGRLEFAAGDPRRRGCMLVNAACELLPRDTTTCQTVRAVTLANRDALEQVLSAAENRGEIRLALDARSVADFLMACLTGLLVTVKVDTDLASVTRTVDIALSAIGAVQVHAGPPNGRNR